MINSSKGILKICWFISIIASIACYVYYVYDNIIEYLNYDIITQVTVEKTRTLLFPTVTFCLAAKSYAKRNFLTIINCSFEGKYCDLNDFRPINIHPQYVECIQFNSGKNSSGHSVQLKTMKSSSLENGLIVSFFLEPKKEDSPAKLKVFVGEHNVQPTTGEFKNVYSGAVYYYEILKKVDSKLERPYNECYCDISKENVNSTFVKDMLSKNIYYRRENCLNDCYRTGMHLDECLPFCPQECDSITYELYDKYFDNEIYYGHEELMNFTSLINSRNISEKEVTFNELKEAITTMGIRFRRLETYYIKQIPKSSLVGLVANVGGLSGLFLETSLLSVYRVVHFFIDCLV